MNLKLLNSEGRTQVCGFVRCHYFNNKLKGINNFGVKNIYFYNISIHQRIPICLCKLHFKRN